MALSTTSPKLSIRPIIVATFNDQPMKYRAIIVVRSDNGIAKVMISVMRTARKKKKSTMAANSPPHRPEFLRLPTELITWSPWFQNSLKSKPSSLG